MMADMKISVLGILMVFTCISYTGCWSTGATSRPSADTPYATIPPDEPVNIKNFTCKFTDLDHANCSWTIVGDVIVTENNAPVLKSCAKNAYECTEQSKDINCTDNNTLPLGYPGGYYQFCYFKWNISTPKIQVLSMGHGRIDYLPSGKPFDNMEAAKPLSPTSVQIAKSTNDSLYVVWEPPKDWNSEIELRIIQYRVEFSMSNESKEWNRAGSTYGDNKANIYNLLPYRSYWIRVQARNTRFKPDYDRPGRDHTQFATGDWSKVVGKSEWSEIQHERTSEYVPATPKHLLKPSAGNEEINENGSCVVNVSTSWDAFEESEWNGPSGEFLVRICPGKNGSETCNKTTTTTNEITTVLEVGHAYNISILASNGRYKSQTEASEIDLTDKICSPEYPVYPGAVTGNNQNVIQYAISGTLLFMFSVFLISLFVKRHLLKRSFTSHLKGPIVIPNTNIVGSVKFREMEIETFTPIVDVDWNPSYNRYHSTEDEAFNSVQEDRDISKPQLLQTDEEYPNQGSLQNISVVSQHIDKLHLDIQASQNLTESSSQDGVLLSPVSTCSSPYVKLRNSYQSLEFCLDTTLHYLDDSSTLQASDPSLSMPNDTLQKDPLVSVGETNPLNQDNPSILLQTQNQVDGNYLDIIDTFKMFPSDSNRPNPDDTHKMKNEYPEDGALLTPTSTCSSPCDKLRNSHKSFEFCMDTTLHDLDDSSTLQASDPSLSMPDDTLQRDPLVSVGETNPLNQDHTSILLQTQNQEDGNYLSLQMLPSVSYPLSPDNKPTMPLIGCDIDELQRAQREKPKFTVAGSHHVSEPTLFSAHASTQPDSLTGSPIETKEPCEYTDYVDQNLLPVLSTTNPRSSDDKSQDSLSEPPTISDFNAVVNLKTQQYVTLDQL